MPHTQVGHSTMSCLFHSVGQEWALAWHMLYHPPRTSAEECRS